MKTKNQIFSNFVLKIIALITMTIDHIGMFMLMYSPVTGVSYDSAEFWACTQNAVGYVFKIIGRLAFPIFAFLLAEGMYHSKNKVNYILRLSVLGIIITVAEAIITATMPSVGILPANIFVDLSLAAVAIYLLEKKNKFSLLALLPLGYNILTFVANYLDASTVYTIHWLPTFIRTQYSLYGFILVLGFYYCRKLARRHIEIDAKKSDIDPTQLYDSYYEENIKNIYCAILLVLTTVFFWIITYMNVYLDVYSMRFQSYAMVAALFIFLYNGKRGFNAKWFQYASYLYYPLHLVIIYGVFYLIFLI